MSTVHAVPTVLTVRLFARYAELFGAELLEIPAENIATVAELLTTLRARPGGAVLGPGTLVAVNLRQARPNDRVSPGDEIALLPPLAGG